MDWKIYLSGEIHSSWREEIIVSTEKENLPIKFFGPVTDHDASDDCGVKILGNEENKFWHDNKGAKINAIRTRKGIEAVRHSSSKIWRKIQTVECCI